MPRKKRVPQETTAPPGEASGFGSTEVTLEVVPAAAPPAPLMTIGQKVRLLQEFKGPGGLMRSGTETVIEGCQVAGGQVRYKILNRGFRFWVPAEIVEPQ